METTIYQNGAYLKNNPRWHSEDSPWKAKQILTMLGRNQITPQTVAEIGCGAGGVLANLSGQMGPEVSFAGYEISAQAYAMCKEIEQPRVSFHLADLLAESDLFFDLVLAIDVFEHVEDYLGWLRRLRSRGAFKIFHIPLDLSVQTVLRSEPIMRARSQVGHLHYFSKETAMATLEHAGHEIIDWQYTASSIDLRPRDWRSKALRLPRKAMFSLDRDMAVRILGGYSLLVLTR